MIAEQSEQTELYDVTIIGGGPAGMYAAFYSGMREMRTKIIEAKGELGGFMRMYPEKMIWDVGGVQPIRCDALIASLERQAQTFQPTIVLGQRILGMQRLPDGTMMLESDNGERHHTRTVLLCAGRGITQMQRLEIEGADRYEVTNLHYTIMNLERFRGKRVLISGGGNSAVDWANELAEYARQVSVVHRREKFDAMESQITRMYGHADVRTPYVVSKLYGDGEQIRYVDLTHAETGEVEQLEVDEVVVNHGYIQNFGLLLEWGLQQSYYGIAVDNRMATGLPGVFGAGDFVTHDSKVRLIAGAFNDAILAVNSAKLYLDPGASKMAGVSSHHELFHERNKALVRR
jgi:thioredoxin reductase